MEYNIKKLAEISRVSVRTIHYYDEIGLLKPAFRKAGGERFYETEQLFRLLNILFFKKTGIKLKKIKSLLELSNLELAAALSVQKQVLLKEIEKLKELTESIDKTISHYKGSKMTQKEICEQFKNVELKMKEYEQLSEKKFGKKLMDEVRKKAKEMSPKDWEAYGLKNKAVLDKLIIAINNKKSECSKEVQALMQEFFELSKLFPLPVSKENFLTLRDRLCKEPAIRKVYENLHPKLPDFLYNAMSEFANHAIWE